MLDLLDLEVGVYSISCRFRNISMEGTEEIFFGRFGFL